MVVTQAGKWDDHTKDAVLSSYTRNGQGSHERRTTIDGEENERSMTGYSTSTRDLVDPGSEIGDETGVEVFDLLDRFEHAETIVQWIHDEWSEQSGRTYAETKTRFVDGIERGKIPITVVALSQGEVIGVASLREDDGVDWIPGLTPWITAVYVHETARGNGVARRLCSTLEKLAEELGVSKLFLATSKFEDSLYHRMGYEHYGFAEHNGETAAILFKRICRPPSQ